MTDVRPIAPTRISGTDFRFAQGMRAGNWLFFTGHEATDYESGLVPQVVGKMGLPLGGQARYRREGDFLFERFSKLIAAEGSDLRHIVRVDQYYPRAECVNPYQRARGAHAISASQNAVRVLPNRPRFSNRLPNDAGWQVAAPFQQTGLRPASLSRRRPVAVQRILAQDRRRTHHRG
jgi:hypothetical protein